MPKRGLGSRRLAETVALLRSRQWGRARAGRVVLGKRDSGRVWAPSSLVDQLAGGSVIGRRWRRGRTRSQPVSRAMRQLQHVARPAARARGSKPATREVAPLADFDLDPALLVVAGQEDRWLLASAFPAVTLASEPR